MKVGRKPYPFTEDIAEEICNRLVDGESMSQIAADESMPSRSTILRWQENNESFDARCERARKARAEAVHDHLVDIVNQVIAGTMAVDVARVAASIEQWRAAKLWPKRWGDKQEHIHAGPGGGPIVSSTMTPEEFEDRAKKIASEV